MAINNRHISGSRYNAESAFVKAKPSFSRKDSVTITPVAANQAFWDYAINGDYLYAATHTAGITVFNISNLSNISHVATIRARNELNEQISLPITDVYVLGNQLFAACRTISATPGFVIEYDITTPQTPTWVQSYKPAENIWYQGLDSDGTYIYVASQLQGLQVFNPADISTPHGSLTTGDWETSRIAVHNGYAYMANHGYGLRIVDIATPSSPGAVTDIEIDMPNVHNVDLRIRNCVAEGNYLYCSVNTAGSVNHPERGLLVLDISNPPAIPTNGSTWINCSIGAQDVDIWNETGDKPILGIAKLDDYVYLSNGQKGVAVFDVSDPTSPKYVGIYGSMEAGTNLYKVEPFKIGNKTYVIYGDGLEPTGEQMYTLYIDEILTGNKLS